MKPEVLTRKHSPALWQLVGNNWIPTDLYGELLFQYLTGELSRERFMERSRELEEIYDGVREPF
jgi:hypothetical protein